MVSAGQYSTIWDFSLHYASIIFLAFETVYTHDCFSILSCLCYTYGLVNTIIINMQYAIFRYHIAKIIFCCIHRLWNNYVKKDSAFTLEAARTLCERGVVRVDGGYQFSADTRIKRPYGVCN